MESTSGSSGKPVKFYASVANAKYMALRLFAQDLMEQRDFRENKVKIDFEADENSASSDKYFKVSTIKSGCGPLATVFEEGRISKINTLNTNKELLEELGKHTPHTIIARPNGMDSLLEMGGVELLVQLGVKRWIQMSESRSEETDKSFRDAGIDISANYSCEEVGPIAFECSKCPGHYHVAESNVVLEADDSLTTEVDGEILSRVLLTHLHSYATPFIRYDVGDFAKLSNTCDCGHDGPTLSHIYGRAKRFICFPDGRYIPLQFRAKEIFDHVDCTEFQIHQKDLKTIVIHIGGRESLNENEVAALNEFIRNRTGADFDVVIRPVLEIDWYGNPKRLGFTSAVS